MKHDSKNVMSVEEAKEKSKKQNLSADDLEKTKTVLIKMVQSHYFSHEIKKLQEKNSLPKDNKLKSLYPFLDTNGVLRVGGRLQNSEFSYNKKHPIIIPYGCHLMKLIIRDAHVKTLHGGNQLTL